MAKRKRDTTFEKIEKWIKEGRGQGERENYKPWLTIQDVPSKGTAPRHKGWKVKRIYHLMSKLELHYLYELEWSETVLDIREQYPLLPIERTIEIAESLGIKHPTDPKTKELAVMTTDFMITAKTTSGTKLFARQIKPTDKLKQREIEKFAIEQHYYREQEIDWAIVTEKYRDDAFVKNMDWLSNAKYIEYFPGLTENTIHNVAASILRNIQESNEPLSYVALECDSRFGFEGGCSLFIIKYMLANKFWTFDIYSEANPMRKIDIQVNGDQMNKGGISYG